MADVIINKTIKVSISEPTIPSVVPLMQYDAGFRSITCETYIDGVQYEVPAAVTVSLTGIRYDGTYFQYDSETASDVVYVSDGVIMIIVTDTMTATAGRTACDVRILDSSGNVLGAFPFVMSVHAAAVENESVSAGSYSSLLESFLSYATYITDVSVDDDGYIVITVGDGVEVTFKWDEDENIVISY